MAIEKDLLDSLFADYKEPEDLIGEAGLLKQLTKDRGSFPNDAAKFKLPYQALNNI